MNKIIKKNILLVEDDMILALNEKQQLEKYNYEIHHIPKGEDAIELALNENLNIDLILMDINLGKGIDGIQTAKEILKHIDIPIIFLSSYTKSEIVEQAEQVKAYGYILKNSGIVPLNACIQMALRLWQNKNITNKTKETIHTKYYHIQNDEYENQDMFARLFHFSPIGLSLSTLKEGRYIDVNDEVLKIYESTREEMIGKTSLELGIWVNPDSRTQIVSHLNKEGVIRNLEIEVQIKSGKILHMLFSAEKIMINNEMCMLSSALDITDRKWTEDEIKKQLNEKELILKEVHHRLKNNIASIISLLKMQAASISNMEAKDILSDAIGRVRSILTLYDKLLFTDDYRELSIKNYLEDIISSIVHIFPDMNKINFIIEIEDFILSIKKMFPIGIIVNELLTNSMKHAFGNKNKGNIKIKISRKENEIILLVNDNGIGFPDDFNFENNKHFGLKLVKILVHQLNGTFQMKNENGTHNMLKFELY